MKNRKVNYSIIILTILTVALTFLSCSTKDVFATNEKSVYKVIRVVDGDTYIISDKNGIQEKIRLLGVNTPETKHPKKGVEPYGPEATAFALKYLDNKKVKLVFDKALRDRYNRVLAHVFVDKIHFNKILIDSGLGKPMFYKPNYMYQEAFKQAEKIAKENQIGIWSKRKETK